MSATTPAAEIRRVDPIIGLEVHVELATRTKMFSRCPNPAHPESQSAEPNTLIDPTVLALPGALPVINRAAVEMSIMVGQALGCSTARLSRWDRKSYFYPDLPKGYQISQYQLPLCFDGAVELPALDAAGGPDFSAGAAAARIGILRAHLEEDTGKLLHEAPAGSAGGSAGGRPIEDTILDLNRAGTPLLEIVTAPDFTSADQVVLFARTLRNICRFLRVSEGDMQKGHMRFEPNINCSLTLADGRVVKTPIVEVKNLNSFRSLKGAIEYELAHQPQRWREDRLEMGPGAKRTRGWSDTRLATLLQREKEDVHDYRYFPDPDLPPVAIGDGWLREIRARVPELPMARMRRYIAEYGLPPKDAAALTDERDVCLLYEAAVDAATERGLDAPQAGRAGANLLLQAGAKRANERGGLVSDLPITAAQIAGIALLRESGEISATSADELFGLFCGEGKGAGAILADADPAVVAEQMGLLVVRDEGQLDAWCEQAIRENEAAAADVRAGRQQALGRLIGAVMKLSGGAADARRVRVTLLERLRK
jgi:aspartyl-tRNA(Asn)/glutamyl-tRNA(Gln) amidotransferase subunit B